MVFLAAEGCSHGGFSMFGRLMAPFWESRDVGTGWESGIIGWAVAAPEQHQAVQFSNCGGPGVGQVLAISSWCSRVSSGLASSTLRSF